MKKNYSRRELQGWGSIKRQVERNDISFSHVEIMPDVLDAYGEKVETLVANILEGVGFPKKSELKNDEQEHLFVNEMYIDLEESALKFISFLKMNDLSEDRCL